MLNNLTKLLASSNSGVSAPSGIATIVNSKTVALSASAGRVYTFKNKVGSASNKYQQNNIFSILKYFFAAYSCLISKPFWTITNNKIILHLCYYHPQPNNRSAAARRTNSRYSTRFGRNLKFQSPGSLRPYGIGAKSTLIPRSKLRSLVIVLSEILQREVELDLVLLRYPYHDSHILAQLIGLNSKRYNFNQIVKKLFKKATIFKKLTAGERSTVLNLSLAPGSASVPRLCDGGHSPSKVPAKLTGIKLKIAGRLTTQRIVPKSTVKTAYKGSFEKSKGSFVESSTYTAKNKLGAYTVRVWLSHKIVN